jgi:hypothetical protein
LDGGDAPSTVPDMVPHCDLALPVHSSSRVVIDSNADSPACSYLACPDGDFATCTSLTHGDFEVDHVPHTIGWEFSSDGHVSSTDVGCRSPSGAARGSSVAQPRTSIVSDSSNRTGALTPVLAPPLTESAPAHPSTRLQHGI